MRNRNIYTDRLGMKWPWRTFIPANISQNMLTKFSLMPATKLLNTQRVLISIPSQHNPTCLACSSPQSGRISPFSQRSHYHTTYLYSLHRPTLLEGPSLVKLQKAY